MPSLLSVLDPTRDTPGRRFLGNIRRELGEIYEGLEAAAENPKETLGDIISSVYTFGSQIAPDPITGRPSSLAAPAAAASEALQDILADPGAAADAAVRSVYENPVGPFLAPVGGMAAGAIGRGAVRGARAAGRAATSAVDAKVASRMMPLVDEMDLYSPELLSPPLTEEHPLRRMTSELTRRMGDRPENINVRLITADAPVAAMGPERVPGAPRDLLVSRGLMQGLGKSELAPIIAHEIGHSHQRAQKLKEASFTIPDYLEDAMSHIPAYRRYWYRRMRMMEHDADRRAAAATSPNAMARALRGVHSRQRMAPVVRDVPGFTRGRDAVGDEGFARVVGGDVARTHPTPSDRITELLRPGTKFSDLSEEARRGGYRWAPPLDRLPPGWKDAVTKAIADNMGPDADPRDVYNATDRVIGMLENPSTGKAQLRHTQFYAPDDAEAGFKKAAAAEAAGYDPVRLDAQEYVSDAAKAADEAGIPRSDPNHPINVPRDNLNAIRMDVSRMMEEGGMPQDRIDAVMQALPDLPHGSEPPVAFYKPWRDAIKEREALDDDMQREYLFSKETLSY